MAPKFALIRWLCVGLGLTVLSACSLPQLAYNNADTVLRFMLDDYFDLNPEQEALLDRGVQRFHSWHRREELPRYAELFYQAAQTLESGVQPERVTETIVNVRQRYRRLVERAFDEATPALHVLRPENVANLGGKFEERNADYADEFIDGTQAQRNRARAEALQKHLERWLGELNPAQEKRVADFIASQPDYAAITLRHRQARQQAVIRRLEEIARHDGNEHQQIAQLRAFLVQWERHASPEYLQLLAQWERGFTQLLVDLDRQSDESQRREAALRLRRYGDELQRLSQARSKQEQARGASDSSALSSAHP